MTADSFDVLIVGSGHGGAQAAITLRQLGFRGTVALVTEETDIPYERPPLSKDYLAGGKNFDRILIRPAEFWQHRGIQLLTGRHIVEIRPATRQIFDHEGRAIMFGKLIWAAGGHARRLTCNGAEASGVHSIRCRADVDLLTRELPSARSVTIIGGGYIGLEAAAVLVQMGKRVTVLETQNRVLARVAGERLSRFYESEHRARGVELRLNVKVDCIEVENGRAAAVALADGTLVRSEVVIVGIGIVPSVGPLRNAGAVGINGVDVDEFCRTTLSGVYAIGDCAAHFNSFAADAHIRLESVQNATEQAICAARDIVGDPKPHVAVPWFWSNQYDLRLQTVGLSVGYDESIVRGDPAARRFSLVYLKKGRVIALDCVNATKDYIQGKGLVAGRHRVGRSKISDESISLKEMATAS